MSSRSISFDKSGEGLTPLSTEDEAIAAAYLNRKKSTTPAPVSIPTVVRSNYNHGGHRYGRLPNLDNLDGDWS